nr:flavin reductase family protein [Streptomyces sp. SID14478]
MSAAPVRERFDGRAFRDALGRFASGVTVIAGLDAAGDPAGLACQSFASLSLDPPLVLACIARTSTSWARLLPTGRFSVSILADDQKDVCAALGRPGPDKFAGVPLAVTRDGGIRIEGALAHLDCTVDEAVAAGDHDIVVGRVTDLRARGTGRPLLFYRSGFGTGNFAPDAPAEVLSDWL